MRLLSSYNQAPNCLSLTLEPIPLESPRKFDLCLALNLNQDPVKFLEGSLRVGIRGAKLELTMENCLVAPSDTECFSYHPQLSEIHPTWLVSSKPRHTVLTGSWQNNKIGTVTLTAPSAKITATVKITPEELCLTEIEGLWKHDLSPNKHGILERKLALFLFENYFTPYVSYLELGTGDLNSTTIEPRKPLIPKEALEEIRSLIHSVYHCATDDFLTLGKLAKLNPLKDFAGANLVGSDLSGVDLNSAYLASVNLRGSNLTDADLSEADLSHANFSGADLSGAYLESANLSHSNCHRASLALANLIAVNLTEANLLETNLSNTNLSSAKVKGAVFGQNTGLSEEEKQELLQRGAIFS